MKYLVTIFFVIFTFSSYATTDRYGNKYIGYNGKIVVLDHQGKTHDREGSARCTGQFRLPGNVTMLGTNVSGEVTIQAYQKDRNGDNPRTTEATCVINHKGYSDAQVVTLQLAREDTPAGSSFNQWPTAQVLMKKERSRH
jgi:hypothetical protein